MEAVVNTGAIRHTMQNLTAEVIAIGDEMTSGARLDTNSAWLSRRLGQLGIDVQFHTTVGDTLSHNVDVLRIACGRADIILTSGGLGPTRDDLTREALSQLSGEPLELRRPVLKQIETMFATRGRPMAQRNELQAMFPRGSVEIPNLHGTAPGIEMEIRKSGGGRSRLFALPGVPAEMKEMFDQTVAPRLLATFDQAAHIGHRVLKFFGTGESDMEQRLGEMIARERVPRVGITVSAATISLRITAMGESESSCEAMIESTRSEILARAGEFYYGEGEGFELHHAIEAALREAGQSVVIVEFGYAAPLGDWFATLGDTPTYRGAVSLSTVDQLCEFAGEESLREAMRSLKERFSADWILVLDHYPSLAVDSALALPAAAFRVDILTAGNQYRPSEYKLAAHPDILHSRIAKTALAKLRHLIAGHDDDVSN